MDVVGKALAKILLSGRLDDSVQRAQKYSINSPVAIRQHPQTNIMLSALLNQRTILRLLLGKINKEKKTSAP